METSGEMRSTNDNISVVMAKLTEIESLSEAFQGCRGVFHTSAFIDPAGLSGYTVSLFLTASFFSLSQSHKAIEMFI
jgi:hypothetical protein